MSSKMTPIFFIWLLLISICYSCLIYLVSDSIALGFWFLLWLTSLLFSMTTVFAFRWQRWRYLFLIQPLAVLVTFFFWSPVRPFVSFYFSLHPDMTLPEVRAAVTQTYAGTSFRLPSEENWRPNQEEKKVGISKKLYLVDPHNVLLDCDAIFISFNPEGKLVTARYSSFPFPDIRVPQEL